MKGELAGILAAAFLVTASSGAARRGAERISLTYAETERTYLFGHSGGACWALQLALLDPELFAAVAVHAGALDPTAYELIPRAGRKTPISIQVGTEDPYFPLSLVRETRDRLREQGFVVELREIPGHGHWYFDLAPKINQRAWDFLRQYPPYASSEGSQE